MTDKEYFKLTVNCLDRQAEQYKHIVAAFEEYIDEGNKKLAEKLLDKHLKAIADLEHKYDYFEDKFYADMGM